jgi:GDP-D-mannose 3', 5'-epimerase
MAENITVITGAGGFIGGHLVAALREQGARVRAVDIKPVSEWYQVFDDVENVVADLKLRPQCDRVSEGAAEVFQLAADMGGMGFISFAECEIMRNNALINGNMIHTAAALGVPRYCFSSSVCVYRDMAPGEAELMEDEAYPAQPDNEYGWEKLYAERVAMAYARRYGLAVRIARFQNCYGPDGTWTGGREKAPAAICRKVAEVEDRSAIEVWGDGSAIRSYTYVDDMVDGIYRLMQSGLEGPVNIGSPEYVTVAQLVDVVARVAGKTVAVRYVPGPVGVRSRNFSNARIESLGWRSRFSLEAGIGRTYPWVAEQVRRARAEKQAPHAAPTRTAANHG